MREHRRNEHVLEPISARTLDRLSSVRQQFNLACAWSHTCEQYSRRPAFSFPLFFTSFPERKPVVQTPYVQPDVLTTKNNRELTKEPQTMLKHDGDYTLVGQVDEVGAVVDRRVTCHVAAGKLMKTDTAVKMDEHTLHHVSIRRQADACRYCS